MLRALADYLLDPRLLNRHAAAKRRFGLISRVSGEVSPRANFSAATKAIIAALSVHKPGSASSSARLFSAHVSQEFSREAECCSSRRRSQLTTCRPRSRAARDGLSHEHFYHRFLERCANVV